MLNPPLEPPVEQCDLTPSHDIGAVQGSGFSTPLAGQNVSVRGVVVGDVPGIGGFYLQDDGDSDAATSDGIFVATSAAVGLGDTVAVAGTAGENFGETRITPGEVDVCSTGLRGEPAGGGGLLTCRPPAPPASRWRGCWWSRWTR